VSFYNHLFGKTARFGEGRRRFPIDLSHWAPEKLSAPGPSPPDIRLTAATPGESRSTGWLCHLWHFAWANQISQATPIARSSGHPQVVRIS